MQRPDGLEPPASDQMEIDEWERQTGRVLTEEDVDEVAGLVTWCFVSATAKLSRLLTVVAGQMGRPAARSM